MQITINPEGHWIECGGIKYSFEMFQRLGMEGLSEGAYFQIVKREDTGMITIVRFDPKLRLSPK